MCECRGYIASTVGPAGPECQVNKGLSYALPTLPSPSQALFTQPLQGVILSTKQGTAPHHHHHHHQGMRGTSVPLALAPQGTWGAAPPAFLVTHRRVWLRLSVALLTYEDPDTNGQGPRVEAPTQRRKGQTIIALPLAGVVLGELGPQQSLQTQTDTPGPEIMTVSFSAWS